MAQILQQQDLGSILGAGVGQGLSSGLQQLAARKLEKIARHDELQRNISGLKALGIKDAEHIAHLEPKILEQVVKQKLQAPGEQAYANALSSLLGGEQQQNRPQMQEQEIGDHSYTPEVRQQIGSYLQTPEAQQQYTPKQIQKVNQFLQSPAPQPQQQASQSSSPSLQGLNAKQVTEIAKLGFQKKKLDVQERKLQHQMKKDALAETKELRKEILDKKKVAKESIENLDRLEELEGEGLPGAGYVEFLKNSGLDIPALVGAPAEEYNKVAAGFLRGAKTMFGSRLTDADLNQFLKLLPSLSNSPKGRSRINANLKRFYNLDIAAGQAYDEIIKDNKGIPPIDLDVQIDRKLDKKREAIAKQFKADLEKEVPKGESSIATAFLAGSGKLISNIPKAAEGALKGAAAGAYIGKQGGPIGVGGGAIIGGISGLLGYVPSLKDVI